MWGCDEHLDDWSSVVEFGDKIEQGHGESSDECTHLRSNRTGILCLKRHLRLAAAFPFSHLDPRWTSHPRDL